MVGHASLVVAQSDVHKYISQGSFKADHQRLYVFAGFIALSGGHQQRGMHAKMEALIVKRAHCVAHNLVGQFENGFFDQSIGLGQFRTCIVAGHAQSGLRFEITMVRQSGVAPMSSVEQGADAILNLATSAAMDGRSGLFFNGQREARADAQAYDLAARQRLKTLSLELSGLSSNAPASVER